MLVWRRCAGGCAGSRESGGLTAASALPERRLATAAAAASDASKSGRGPTAPLPLLLGKPRSCSV